VANEALALLTRKSDPAIALDDENLTPEERQEFHNRYYEVHLMLAEAIAQPIRQESLPEQLHSALRILDRAIIAHAPSRVYYLRKMSYLDKLGDFEGAARERDLAERVSTTGETIDDFLQGEQAYRLNQLTVAIGHFNRVLAASPEHFWAQYLLSICQIKAQRFQEALTSLTSCQSRRPNFVWIYLLRGYAEGELKEFDLAESDFRKAAALGLSDDARYVWLVNRGVMRMRKGEGREAVEDFRSAIELKPRNFQAYVNLAQAYLAGQEWEKARQCLDRAIGYDPDQAILYQLRGELALQRKDDRAAFSDFQRAIEFLPSDDPRLAEIHLELGRIKHRARRYAEAVEAFDRAIKLRPELFSAHRMRGASLMELRRFDEAIQSFDLCVASGKSSPSLLEARGLAHSWKGAYAEAILDYSLALQAAPRSPTILAHRGWAYLFSHAPRMAERDFEAAIQINPTYSDAYSGLGMSLALLHRKDEAIESAVKSVTLSPNDPRTAYNAARVYCQIAADLQTDLARLSDRDFRILRTSKTAAMDLVRRAISLASESEQSQLWCEVIRSDDSLEPIRNLPDFRKLDTSLGIQRPTRGGSNAQQIAGAGIR
jgi:tetratricopeptide (TPR) repeat protein